MTLPEFRDLLLTVTDRVYHCEPLADSGRRYIVWNETKGRSIRGNGQRKIPVRRVQVDLYTDREYDPLLDKLLGALEGANRVGFGEPIPSYDPTAKMFRYIVECEVF